VLDLIGVNNITKSYENNIVLNNVSFTIVDGMKAGLVGANGSGKSTLLRVIAGLESRDSGQISYPLSPVIGYLPQYLPHFSGRTIDELIIESAGELRKVENRLRQLAQDMAICKEGQLDSLLEEYGEISRKFQACGGYEIDYRINKILEGLGIGYLDRSLFMDTLSGGEKTRVNLATILLKSPDVLLFDEPTNNLDSCSMEWLETYLTGYKGAAVVASHDRQFLNNIVNEIYEIDEHSHQLKKYNGDYDAYKLAKDAERIKWEDDYRSQQEEISELKRRIKVAASAVRPSGRKSKLRDNDKFIPHFKGQRVDKSASHVIHDAEEHLGRILKNPISRPPKPLRFKATFKSQCIRSKEVVRATDIIKFFGDRSILQGITFSLRYDSRVVITGFNGTGKTTLLRILANMDSAYSGTVTYAPGVRIGFLSQEPEPVDSEKTALEYYSHDIDGCMDDFIFGLVTCGLFRHEDLNKKVGQISLGQLRKLQIARMIATEPNVLILDEPTNHISLDVLESFESAIAEFQGPVLSVSHDRRFIRQFDGEVWELKNGKLINSGNHPDMPEK
jgi:macrolide transport system ATP-binding/permease protein